MTRWGPGRPGPVCVFGRFGGHGAGGFPYDSGVTTGEGDRVPEARVLDGEPGGARALRQLNDWMERIETGTLALLLALLVGTGVDRKSVV